MKKQLLKSALIAVAGVGLMTGSAMATLVNNSGIEQNLNGIFAGQGWTIDDNANQVSYDELWSLSEPDTGAWATIIVEIAGNANSNVLGIYDGTNYTNIFSGSDTTKDKVSITIGTPGSTIILTNYDWNGTKWMKVSEEEKAMGSIFGFYISGPSGTFKSETSENSDGLDHMVSYAGTGSNGLSVGHYALAFEDSAGALGAGSDRDFNDMVIKVESINPVPEPASLLLLGTGIAGLAGIARRRKGSK